MRFATLVGILVFVFWLGPIDPVQADRWQDRLIQADSVAKAQLFDSAVTLTKQAVQLATLDAPIPDSLRAALDEHLGRSLCAAAHYDEAEPHLRHALEIQQKLFGYDHPDIASTLEDLAWVKLRQAKLAYAEYLSREAVSLRERNSHTTPLQLAAAYEGLASIISHTKSKLPETEQLIKHALAIRKAQPGAQPIDWANTMFSLASCYRVWDQVPKADTLFQDLLIVYQTAYGDDDLRVGKTLSNLGSLNLYLGNYQIAEVYLGRALKVELRHLPEIHPTVALTCFTLGVTLRAEDRLEESEQYVRRALKIWEATSGPNHPDAAGAVEELAGLLSQRGKYDESLEMLARALLVRRQEFRDNYYLLPEHQASEYSDKLRQSVSDYLACYFEIRNPSPLETEAACTWMVNCKGELSEAMFERARRLHAPSDRSTGAIADSIEAVRQQLATLYARGNEPGEKSARLTLDSLEQMSARLEMNFARRCAAVDSLSRPSEWSANEVRRRLPDSTRLLEFMQYGGHVGGHISDGTVRYAVAVITPDRSTLLDLGPASIIDSLVMEYQRASNLAFSETSASNHLTNDTVTRLLQAIYDKLWRPEEAALGVASMVLIAPDGPLNDVSFATLMRGEEYLAERTCLHYLSASRDLRRLDGHRPANTGLLALGDPDYDATATERLRALGTSLSAPATPLGASAPFALRNTRSDCQYFQEVTLASLPYTHREVSDIGACWRSRFHEPVTLLYRAAASEENFKREAIGKRVIHLATHGFFRPETCEGRSPAELSAHPEDPLLSSGLFLAGSNQHGAGATVAGAEDGLLTALEVSCLDLSGTELVVLSACQSGRGTVQSGEGVYGLRRAFQMAGARTVMSALWKIPDKETGRLMTSLYNYRGGNLAVALRSILLDQIRQQRSKKLPQNPFVWGSFITVGDWIL